MLPTLGALQYVLQECSWICVWARECVPNYDDAMNEILDLQRGLHANDSDLCEEHTLGDLSASICLSLLVKSRVSVRSMLG